MFSILKLSNPGHPGEKRVGVGVAHIVCWNVLWSPYILLGSPPCMTYILWLSYSIHAKTYSLSWLML